MTETKTPIRSVAALRQLADQMEALPDDHRDIETMNSVLSNVPAEIADLTDAERIFWILADFRYGGQ